MNAQLERWNKAALTLPPPVRDGNVDMRDDLRFTTFAEMNADTRQIELHWELMTPQWQRTGIVWPSECFVANVENQATASAKPDLHDR